MFRLLPQFIVILSLATIVAIILHRLPDVTVKEEDMRNGFVEKGIKARLGRAWRKLGEIFGRLLKIFIASMHAAKDYTAKSGYLGKVSRALRIDGIRTSFPFRQSGKTKSVSSGGESEAAKAGQAESDLIAVIKRNPADTEAYEELGELYLQKKSYKEASEVYEYLVRTFPENDSYRSKIGTVYFNLGNYESALASYQKAIELNPERANRYINLSLCLEALGKTEEAVQAVEKALAKSPNDVRFMQILADLFIRLQKIPDAQEILEKILEIEPTNHVAREKLMQLKF